MMQCVRMTPQARPNRAQLSLLRISWNIMPSVRPKVTARMHLIGASVFGKAIAFSAASEGRRRYRNRFRKNRTAASASAISARVTAVIPERFRQSEKGEVNCWMRSYASGLFHAVRKKLFRIHSMLATASGPQYRNTPKPSRPTPRFPVSSTASSAVMQNPRKKQSCRQICPRTHGTQDMEPVLI